jgi:hypothetical protein
MKIERKRFSGVMNLDDPNEVIAGTHHRRAYNVVFKGNPGEMSVESAQGNQQVVNTNLKEGTNRCIGSYYDELKQRLFYFVYNSNGYDAIYMYDTKQNHIPIGSRTITTVLMSKIDSLESEPLFNFSLDNPIVSVNMLYRSEEDGDILHWTDRLNRPMKLNIKEALAVNKTYNGNWKKKYLTVARPMPLLSPICKYENDNTVSINNLKSKVYQFRYRWVYKDFTKSTYSPWSRLFAPANVDDIANESNQLLNNVISVKFQTGDADVARIEIAARQSLDGTFSDPFLVDSLNKSALGIGNNLQFDNYKFYNDRAYPFLGTKESNLLFDYVPLRANTQELLNGNILIYGGITEGRTPTDGTNNISLSVTSSTSLVTNTATNTDPFSAFYYDTYNVVETPPSVTGGLFIVFEGTPQVGEVYVFDFTIRKKIEDGLGGYENIYTNVTKTVTVSSSTDTQAELEDWLLGQLQSDINFQNNDLAGPSVLFKLNATNPNYPGKRGIFIGKFELDVEPGGVDLDYMTYISFASIGITRVGSGVPPDITGVNTSCYKHKSRYTFGLCYFDEYGVTNGVMTTNSMKISTPEIVSSVLYDNQLSIPAINFSINNKPPIWAKYYSFVRTTNLTFGEFKTIATKDTYKDLTFGYLNIAPYQTNKSNYTAYSYASGDRVRVVGTVGSPASVKDYPIVGLVTSTEVGGAIPADGIWIKVPYDALTMSTFTTGQQLYLEVYTPSLNSDEQTQIFYEFGETYETKIDTNGNLVHGGMNQDQIIGTGARPATFTFVRGDVYSRQRETKWIIDQSMSDKYPSRVTGNGRPFVVDEYAKETYFPTLVRYSLDYQSGTNINDTNRFYAENFDEYDREKGDIQRLKTRGRQLRVFQNRACGVVPVLQNVVQTVDGSGILSQSGEIINKIQYYQGEYGIGIQYCSLASSARADYFSDPVRGFQVRLSDDGLTPISEIYKVHYFLSPLITKYNKVRNGIGVIGKAKILATYDEYNGEFITALQESTSGADKSFRHTISFNEPRNSYTSLYTYFPEWISYAENVVVSWDNGTLYTHDNKTDYCKYYGEQNGPTIDVIFNQYQDVKKRYNTISILSNKLWSPRFDGDVITSLGQSSKVLSEDFIKKDSIYHAAFKRDMNSTGGLYNGDVLKGNWAEISLSAVNNNQFVNLYYIELSILEPLNNR